MQVTYAFWALGTTLAVAVACGAPDRRFGDEAVGGEGQACFPNATCTGSLKCASKVCVALGSGTGGVASGGMPASAGGAPAGVGGAIIASGGRPMAAGGVPGSSGGAASTGETGGTGPVCSPQITLASATAPAEAAAALCFSLAYDTEDFDCTFDGLTTSTCVGRITGNGFLVYWDYSANPILGAAYGVDPLNPIGYIGLDSSGMVHQVAFAAGFTGTCTVQGNQLRLCVP